MRIKGKSNKALEVFQSAQNGNDLLGGTTNKWLVAGDLTTHYQWTHNMRPSFHSFNNPNPIKRAKETHSMRWKFDETTNNTHRKSNKIKQSQKCDWDEMRQAGRKQNGPHQISVNGSIRVPFNFSILPFIV